MENKQLDDILKQFKDEFDLNKEDIRWFFMEEPLSTMLQESFEKLFMKIKDGKINPRIVVHPKNRTANSNFFSIDPYTGHHVHPRFARIWNI